MPFRKYPIPNAIAAAIPPTTRVCIAEFSFDFFTIFPFIPPTVIRARAVNRTESENLFASKNGEKIARINGIKGMNPITTKEAKVAEALFMEL